MVHAILFLGCRGCADCMAISLLLAAACCDSAHVHLVAVGAMLENSKNMLCLSLSDWLVDLCFVSSSTLVSEASLTHVFSPKLHICLGIVTKEVWPP